MVTHRKADHPHTWAQPNDTVHHKDGWAACWMCEVERLRAERSELLADRDHLHREVKRLRELSWNPLEGRG